jgi:hypothetical protein
VCLASPRAEKKAVLSRTSAGGVSINDVVMHAANMELPFGGVGGSGMGGYHGKFSFEAFTHMKPVMEKYFSDPPLRFPPYTPFKIGVFKFALAHNYQFRSRRWLLTLFLLAVAAAFGVLIWRAALSA